MKYCITGEHIFQGRQYNVTPTSQEHCSQLSCFTEDWMMPFTANSRDSQCFSMGRTVPQNWSSHRGNLDPNLPKWAPQMASQSVQSFLQITSVWPTHRQTDRHTDR